MTSVGKCAFFVKENHHTYHYLVNGIRKKNNIVSKENMRVCVENKVNSIKRKN